MSQLIHLDRLPAEVKAKIVPYMDQLLPLCGAELRSVVIYGSAAGINYRPKDSDINALLIFGKLDFAVLRGCLKKVSAGIRQRIAAPLFLAEDYIRASLDVFPMEFLDMKDNHVLIYGQDILSSLEINTEHLRLFCEQQVKGKLIRIRQAYLEVGVSRRGLEALLKDSLAALIPVFRNLVRLKGQVPAVDKAEVLRQLCAQFELDQQIFLAVYKDTTNDERIAGQEVGAFLEKYVAQIEALAGKVDRL